MNEVSLKPFGADLVVERVSDKEANNTFIHIEDDDHTDIQHYRVVRIGPEVTQVDVGDTIIMSWSNITPPFTQDGKKVGITNEREILGVFEDGSYEEQ